MKLVTTIDSSSAVMGYDTDCLDIIPSLSSEAFGKLPSAANLSFHMGKMKK